MEHLFVPIEVAKLAKKAHFNEPCFGYFLHYSDGSSKLIIEPRYNNILSSINSNLDRDYPDEPIVFAPFYQQLVGWFIDNHGIYIDVYLQRAHTWSICIQNISTQKEMYLDTAEYSDRYEALNQALLKAFELI